MGYFKIYLIESIISRETILYIDQASYRSINLSDNAKSKTRGPNLIIVNKNLRLADFLQARQPQISLHNALIINIIIKKIQKRAKLRAKL